MSKVDLQLEQLINSSRLREELSALTAGSDGDGNDPRIRSKALALLKQISKNGREQAETMLLEDGSGTACAARLSHLQDEIIRCIYDFAIVHVLRVPNMSAGERLSVLAVGGYGRGTLAPGSDLDLLFLLPYKRTALSESVIEYILYMLWDMGYKVGHATRNINQCINLSLEDMTIRTAVLEARYLWGDEQLYEELVSKFDTDIVQKKAPEFIAAKLEERDTRHEKAGQSRYLVEPNVKDGKGGQRDLHTLFWISKYYYRVRSQKELRKAKVFSVSEFNKFSKAQDFLWAVRCHMHFVTGKAEERLSFDIQPLMAERLGYLPHPGMSAVERFMKHYFLVAKDVGDLTRILCSKLEDEQAKKATGVRGIVHSLTHRQKRIRGTDQFKNSHNRITPIDKKVFVRDPVSILRMFQLAEKHGLLFHPDAMRLVTASLKLINKELRQNKEANASFLSVLTSKKTPERTLRKMNESGVLGRFIPDFGKIVAMMQFNMYHHYTVDEHLLRSIGVLSEIEHGELDDKHPVANEIMQKTPNRVALYVALLLHDVAKGRPEEHSIAGARVARKLCPRLGLDKKQTELVAWLIEHHLIMSSLAQTRDLNDPKTISDFANTMQTLEQMKALLVLTVCDIKAVGPGVWNGWKGQLLRTLFHETEPLLTGGFTQTPRLQRIGMVKQELREALNDWSNDDLNWALNLCYTNYLLTVSLEDQIRHLNFIREADAAGKSLATTVATRSFEAVTEITLVAPDHPRLLSTITGCCSAAGANIVDAQIFTTRDGRALDTIYINRLYDEDDDEYRRAQSVAETIEKVLMGKVRLKDLLSEQYRPKSRTQAFKVESSVSINNELSNKFTVIEIEGLDRPGLLSDVAGALADLSLNIGSAHIATFGEKVIDSFYAVDLLGQKITNPQKLAAVKRRILGALEGEVNSSEGKSIPNKKAIA